MKTKSRKFEFGTNLNSKQEYIIRSESEGKDWNLEDYLVFDILMPSYDMRPSVQLEFCQGNQIVFCMFNTFVPERRVRTVFPIAGVTSKKWFMPTFPGNLKGVYHGMPADLDTIDSVHIRFNVRDRETDPEVPIKIFALYLSKELPDFEVHGEPLVDEFGQRIKGEWIDKTHSEQELKDALLAEYESYLRCDTFKNPDWDQFGGWKKLHFEPKGYFYPAENEGIKWLIDPEGNAFYSTGFSYGSGTRVGCFGFIHQMEELYTWLPDKGDPLYKYAYTTPDRNPEYVKRNGPEFGTGRTMFNFQRANLMRVFGEEWLDAWCVLLRGRMKKWGLNTTTIGVDDFGDEPGELYAQRLRMPFIFRMEKFPITTIHIFRDFPDVYSEEYEKASAVFAKQLEPFVGKKHFMGYYMYNEPEWMTASDDMSISELALASEEPLVTAELIREKLQEQYGTVEMLNKSWKTAFVSFAQVKIPEEKTDQAMADITKLNRMVMNRFWEVPSRYCAEVAAPHINFGYRCAWVASELAVTGWEHLDVFSYNCYRAVPTEMQQLVDRWVKKPTIISEWHMGEIGPQLYTSGVRGSKGREARAYTCNRFFNQSFVESNSVGCHYFEYGDMPLLGRYDGAAASIGLVDVCCRPYREYTDMMEEQNYHLYEIHSGQETREYSDNLSDVWEAW